MTRHCPRQVNHGCLGGSVGVPEWQRSNSLRFRPDSPGLRTRSKLCTHMRRTQPFAGKVSERNLQNSWMRDILLECRHAESIDRGDVDDSRRIRRASSLLQQGAESLGAEEQPCHVDGI